MRSPSSAPTAPAPGRFEIARAKAHGAVMLGIGGRGAARPGRRAGLFHGRPVGGVFDGAILPVPGGVLVRDASGAVIGAVGVTGDTSDNDAAAAEAGIRAAGLQPEA